MNHKERLANKVWKSGDIEWDVAKLPDELLKQAHLYCLEKCVIFGRQKGVFHAEWEPRLKAEMVRRGFDTGLPIGWSSEQMMEVCP